MKFNSSLSIGTFACLQIHFLPDYHRWLSVGQGTPCKKAWHPLAFVPQRLLSANPVPGYSQTLPFVMGKFEMLRILHTARPSIYWGKSPHHPGINAIVSRTHIQSVDPSYHAHYIASNVSNNKFFEYRQHVPVAEVGIIVINCQLFSGEN